jgi:Ribbon-helix-helix domain
MQVAKRKNPNRLVKELMSIYLDPPQAKALRALKARTGAPVNHYMREGVKLILARYKDLAK